MADLRALIVDDAPDVVLSLQHHIEEALPEASVTTVLSGTDALVAMAKATFDVVICDLIMPDMDGLQVLEHAKKHMPQARRILITGIGGPDAGERASAAGVDAFLRKPFDLDAFTKAVLG